MEAPAEAATAAPADPVSEAEKADAGQLCSTNGNITDAINAAWPGGEASARFRRAVAGLLLRSQRKCLRPHTMTNADLGEEVRDRHQQLVAELLPRGGKLKFSKLLLRQPGEAGAGTTPEFFVMEQVGGAPGVRLELKQLLRWWKGGQEQHSVTGAWDEDSTTAGGSQDAHAPGTIDSASATEQDAIAVQPTAADAPVQAAADATRGAVSHEPTGVGTERCVSLVDTLSPQPSREDTYAAGAPAQGRRSSSAGSAGTVFPVPGALDAAATEEQLAATASWPGEGPKAQLRRAAAELLLQRTWGPQGPHSLQQAALRKELCKHHPDLVKALAPLGAKLRMQDVLPRQPANPDDRDPDPHPEPRVTRGQGQGGSADEDSWEQLYAEASRGSGESEAAAAGAEAQEGLGAGQEAAGAEDAFRLLPEFFVLGKTAKGEPVVRLDRAAMLRWWRLRAGGHRDSGRATSSRDVGAAAAMEPPAPVQGPARAPVVQELEAMAAQTAACAAGASDQPCSAAVHQPAGRGADEDHVLERTGQERVDAGVGGGGDNEAPVAWDAAGDPGSRPEADGGPGGHLSTAAATNMMQVDAPQGVGVPGTSLSTPVVASVECGHSSGGASDGGNAVGSAAAIGDGPVHLEGGGGEAAPAGAAPADAASADLPRGTPFPASGAAGPAAHLAPHLPSLATLPTPPHAELHGQPPGPTAASDHGLPPPPAGQTTRNALPAIHIEKISQLKQAALKIGSHAPADDILAAVAAAVPGKDQAAMLRRRCALMLLARGSEESQGPYGPYSMAAVTLASAMLSAFPGMCRGHVSGTDDNGLRLAKMLHDTHRTAAGQRPGGADAAGSWRRHEAAPGEGLQAHPPVPQVFIVRLKPLERAAVRFDLGALKRWWSKVGPATAGAGTAAAGPDAYAASSATVNTGSGTGTAAPGQGVGGGRAQASLRPQVAGPSGNGGAAGSPESRRHGADGVHAAQPPSRIASTASPPAPAVSSTPPGLLQTAAAVGGRAETDGEDALGALAAPGAEEETLYLGPQRPGHARASLTAIPCGEGAGGGGGGGGGGISGEGGRGSVRAGGTGAGRSGNRSKGEDPRHLRQRRSEVEAYWEVVCRARGHEGLPMPRGLAAACAAAWDSNGYVGGLRRAAAVLLLVPPPRVEGGGAVDRQAEELGPFTLHEDCVHCELAQFFPDLASRLEGSGGKRTLSYYLEDKSAAGDAKQGDPEQGWQQQQQQQPQAEEGDTDRAAGEQGPARPPSLFTVLETHTGHLALRLNLLALQQWWAGRNATHTHTATPGHGAGRGAGLSPTGRSASPLPPLNPAEPGLWVEALRGRRGHLAPLPSAGLPYADTPFNGEHGAGVAGGPRAAVRWHRSATDIACGIVATGLHFRSADAGAEFVDARLCIREVRLHRGFKRHGPDAEQPAVIAAAWRGGGAVAQLGRRLAAMLSQPPAAAQGPAGPFSMSKAALCSELRAMYPELVAELLLLLSPPQSPPPSQQSPTTDHVGGWGSTGGLPLERFLLLPAYPTRGRNGHAVPALTAHHPFFSFEEYSPGQVAVRLKAEALGLRCDGEAPASRKHKHQQQNLSQGGGGKNSGTAVLAACGADASLGSGTCDGCVLGGSGVEVLQSAFPPPPAPRSRSVLLLDPLDVGTPPWSAGATASATATATPTIGAASTTATAAVSPTPAPAAPAPAPRAGPPQPPAEGACPPDLPTPPALSSDPALASLRLALMDLLPDPPRPTACPNPATASTSTAPAPPSPPSHADLAAWEEQLLEAKVKRAAAEVLALRRPQQRKRAEPARVQMPCDELWGRLCTAVPELLGGRWHRSGWARGLKDLLLEERHVFSTVESRSRRWWVLLVHPELIRRGVEVQRTMAASDTDGAATVTAAATTSATAVTAAATTTTTKVTAAATTSATAVAARGAGAVAGTPAAPVGAAAAQPHLPQQQQQQEQQQQQQPAPQPQLADPAAALRKAVQRRSPYPPRDTAQDIMQRQEMPRLEVEAKRAASLVLAMTGAGALPPEPRAAAPSPPPELPLTDLCIATDAAFGGARPARELRGLLEEEPGGFSAHNLAPQAASTTQYSMRLKHAKLLEEAAELRRAREQAQQQLLLQQEQVLEQVRRRPRKEQPGHEQEQDANRGWPAAAARVGTQNEVAAAVASVRPTSVPLPSTSNVLWPALGGDDWGQLGSDVGADAGRGAEARSNGHPNAVPNGTPRVLEQQHTRQRPAASPRVIPVPVPVPSANAPQRHAAAAAVHAEQQLASLPMVIPIPIPGPSTDAPHHNGTSNSSSSSPAQAAPAPLQQQLQQHPGPHYDPLRQHPIQHTHHPFLHHLLLPPHLVQSLPQTTTVYVHWTGAQHVTGTPPGPAPSSTSSATSSQTHAPAPALGPAHNSWRDAFSQLLTHSLAATQVGVAVVRVAGAPALVALYVPPTATPAAAVLVQGVSTSGQAAGEGAGAAAGETSEGSRVLGATVYVVDMAVSHPDSAEAAAAEAQAAAADGAGEGLADGGLAAYKCEMLKMLRAVLEEGRVAKVVHGAQQVNALEARCGALRSEPLLDTRQLLEAMLLGPFFPNLPPPPPAAPHAHMLLVAQACLRAHVEGLRRALGGTGLWSDRPQLLELLAARQLAALGDEHEAAAGRDRVWVERPLPPDRVLGAAQRAVHLTELWAALAHEALPWAAMHSAAQAAERWRTERAAAAALAAAAEASETGLSAAG